MRVILQIETPDGARRKVWLDSGMMARIGSSHLADIAIQADSEMAPMHFSLDCDQDSCRLTDLASPSGTLVNGLKIPEALLRNGDEITAGMTRFSVVLEGVPAAAVSAGDTSGTGQAAPAADDRTGQIVALLRESRQPLYAILDAARDPLILALVLQSELKYQSLYEGAKGEQLMAAAPYLVELPPDTPFLNKLIDQGWGNSWGVYLTSSASFEDIRKNFRRFLMVETPEKKQVYFRYYDPRVLRVFLPTCTPDEATQFFGPVQSFFVEDKTAALMLVFESGKSGAAIERPIPDLQPAV